MAKEICISDRIIHLPDGDTRMFLEKVAALVLTELGVKVWFCERIGRRWSHYAGNGVMMSAGIRGGIPGADRFGYILEAEPEDKHAWEQILTSISKRLNENQ